MIALRIRGLYATALTQLFRQSEAWEIVQPDEDVRSRIDYAWRMDSPDVAIEDEPNEQGQRDVLRLTGSADAVGETLSLLQQECFDIITRQNQSEVGALYIGLVGIVSRASRQAVVYMGEGHVGILPLRYEDQNLHIGSYIPVRIDDSAQVRGSRPQLSKVLTIPGQYAVLTAARTVRLSKQITDTQQRDRLQHLGAAQATGDWGIIWRTAAQNTPDEVLVQEVQRLVLEAQALQVRLQNATAVGRVRGGDIALHVLMPGHAKAVCDTLRAQLMPTLPGHHKYKARGDVYSATVDALEKELPADVLRSRTANLSVLSSINAMQQPIRSTLRILRHDLAGHVRDQGEVQRVADDLQAGWVEVRRSLQHTSHYPHGLHIDQTPGDYAVTRFHESSWSYVTHFYTRDHQWQGDYAACTTPIAVFSDQIHLVDLCVAVLRTPQQPPEIVGLDALQRQQEQGTVSAALVQKAQAEGEGLLLLLAQERRQEPPSS